MCEVEEIGFPALATFLEREGVADQHGWPASSGAGLIVAYRRGRRILGVAQAWKSWLHPQRWRLSIHVIPDSQCQGIGRCLLESISSRLPATETPELQIATASSNTACLEFLRESGFQPLMTTRLGSLDPAGIPRSWWNRSQRADESLRSWGVSLVTLEARPDLRDDVARLHGRIYRERHEWNPPIELTLRQCSDIFLNDEELEPSMQFVALRDEAPFAVSSLRTTNTPGTLDLGWIGAVDVFPKHAETLYRVLWGRCLEAATRRSTLVTIEIDRVEPYSNAIVDELPVEWSHDWLTFVRPARPANARP